MVSQEHAPARSVVLTTVEMPGAFPPAGGRALEVVPMAVASMAAVGDIGDRMYPRVELFENSRMERNTMLQRISILLKVNARALFDLLRLFYSQSPWGVRWCRRSLRSRGQRTFASAEDAGPLLCRNAGTGRTISLSILDQPERKSFRRRRSGRFGCSRRLRRQIPGDASVRERAERNGNPGCRG